MWHWDCRSATIDNAISNACVFGADWKSAKIHGVLWGDSQAIATMPLLDPIARDANASFVLWSGCPAILDSARVHVYLPEQPAYRAECATKRSVMMHTLKSHPEMSLVVLTAAWPYMTALIADDRSQPDTKVSAKLLEQSLQDTVTEIGAPDRKIVLLGSVPQWPGNDTFECAYRDPALWRAKCAPEKSILPKVQSRAFQRTSTEILSQIASGICGVVAIFPAEAMCASKTCLIETNGELIYYDSAHLRLNLREDTRRELARIIGLDHVFKQ